MEENSMKYSMKNLIDEMEKGRKSTQILRDLLLLRRPRISKLETQNGSGSGEEYVKELEHHSMVALTSCVTSLSLMKGFDMQSGLDVRKRKLNHDHGDHDHESQIIRGEIKHEDLYGEVSNTPTTNTKNKRGCYKRRKSGEGRVEEVTQLRDDGYAWRKYGQKVILKTSHPRNYFRCTHKFDKKCPATKQVQQISNNPTKYRIIYHGDHICNYNNNFNQSTIVIDSNDEHSSAIVLNFDQSSQINPLLFPKSATSANNSTSVKQEYNSPMSDQSTSPDQTAVTGLSWTTLVSEQSDLISTADKCCSTASATECDVEDDYFSSMWTDLEELDGVFKF